MDVGDEGSNLRTNASQEGGNDEDMEESKPKEGSKDELQGLGGPMTRLRSKKAKEALNNFVVTLLEASPSLEELKPKIVNCLIQIEGIEAGELHSV